MKRWATQRLGEVCIAKSGNSKIIKGSLPTQNDGTLFPAFSATGQDVFSEGYDFEGDGIVISAVGARCGKCFLASGKWRAVANTHVILPKPDKANVRFLWYLLNDESFWVKGGTAQPFVKVFDSLKKPIALPPLSEQERIVKLLDKADELRKLRTQADRRTAALIPALFHEMFGGSKSSSFASMPLEEVCGEIYRYPTYYGIEYVKTGVPEIRGELLTNDYSIEQSPEKFRFISQTTSLHFPRTQLSVGDLVMSVRGTIGKLALVPKPLSGANITANLLRISPRKDLLNGEFLLHFLVDGGGISKVAAISTSTTILTLKVADLKKMQVPVPPLSLQKAVRTAGGGNPGAGITASFQPPPLGRSLSVPASSRLSKRVVKGWFRFLVRIKPHADSC